MKEHHREKYTTKAVPVSVRGFLEGLMTAPFEDPLPKKGVMEIGGYVSVRGRSGNVVYKVDEIGSFAPGKEMLVFYVGNDEFSET